ncbi:MAG: hypothetical protein CBC13_06845 [Planctomycetia bacterium TMED53]|nr:MAG: hypothetical protein CBC13_06845 [Planctomycetia bacterium TMED53]
MLERGALAAMGTRFEIIVAGESVSLARAAIESAFAEIENCHRLWNPFSADSLVSQLHEATEHEIPIDGLTHELLSLCQRLESDTKRAFSATTGAFLASRDPRRSVSQDGSEGHQGYFELLENPPRVRISDSRLRWDFGAIAKGFALDLAVEVMREDGIQNAFLHGGSSSVAAIGAAPGLSGWRVQLPQGGILELKDGESLAVSSGHGNYQGDHLVDPLSGDWIENLSFGCWVRGTSTAEADAWATALLVLKQRADFSAGLGTEGEDWGFFEIDNEMQVGNDEVDGDSVALQCLSPSASGDESAVI